MNSRFQYWLMTIALLVSLSVVFGQSQPIKVFNSSNVFVMHRTPSITLGQISTSLRGNGYIPVEIPSIPKGDVWYEIAARARGGNQIKKDVQWEFSHNPFSGPNSILERKENGKVLRYSTDCAPVQDRDELHVCVLQNVHTKKVESVIGLTVDLVLLKIVEYTIAKEVYTYHISSIKLEY